MPLKTMKRWATQPASQIVKLKKSKISKKRQKITLSQSVTDIIDSVGSQPADGTQEEEYTLTDIHSIDESPTTNVTTAYINLHGEIAKLTGIVEQQQNQINCMEQ